MAHNEDDSPPQVVHHRKIPRQYHEPDEVITLRNGGTLQQTEETWSYIWSELPEMDFSDSYLNEWGVCIASDACRSREDKPELTDGGIGYMLRRIVAERAKSAREGVLLAGELIERFGYASSGRTYTICDTREGWLFCAVNGKHWLARRVPDNEVAIIANTYTVHEVDLSDPANFLASKDIIDYAVSRGWYKPERDGSFDFAAAYADPENAVDSSNFCRQWGGLRLVASNPPPLDSRLPFSVKPYGQLGVSEIMTILRDHYENTDLYEADNSTGDPHRTGMRSICAPTTQVSFVAQLRPEMPADIGLVYWVCLGPPCTSFYIPYHFGMDSFPAGYTSHEARPTPEYYDEIIGVPFAADMHKAFWTFANFHYHACANYSTMISRLIKERELLEKRAIALQRPLEKTAVRLYELNPGAGMEILTNYSGGLFMSAMEALKEISMVK
jgi:dipeptidase